MDVNVFLMQFRSVKNFLLKYERHLSGGALLLGFTVDNLTLTRIDLLLDNLILLGYLSLAGLSIVFLNIYSGKPRIKRWMPYVTQYAFGGLFSGYFIFYSRSASFISSWPFLLILVLLLVGNEFLRGKYERTVFTMSIFFIAVFSFLIFFIPVVVGKIGDLIFIFSSIVSLLAIGIFIYLLGTFTHGVTKKSINTLKKSVLIIFVSLNVLYFANIIPPLPLSLKTLQIYYNVERLSSGNYEVSSEKLKWYEFYKKDEIKYVGGTRLYAFSSIFAPTKISDTIFHEWSFYDESKRKWVPRSKIPYGIAGGRDGGYRGFSYKTALENGRWRVDVKTERGQLLGRKKFSVIIVSNVPILEKDLQ